MVFCSLLFLFISVICECSIKIHENCAANETQSILSSRAEMISCICTLDMPAVRLPKTTKPTEARKSQQQNKSKIFFQCTFARLQLLLLLRLSYVCVLFLLLRSLFSSGETISITLNSHSRLHSVPRCESAVGDWTIQAHCFSGLFLFSRSFCHTECQINVYSIFKCSKRAASTG